MDFIFRNGFIRNRYLELCSLPEFKHTISEEKFTSKKYLLGLLIGCISGFMVGYTMYYWAAESIEDIILDFLFFLMFFVLFLAVLQIIRDIIQVKILNEKKNNIRICIFNKFYLISTLEYHHYVPVKSYITSTIIPIVIFTFFPLIIVALGIENRILLSLSLANIILSIPDIIECFYAYKYGKNSNINLDTRDNKLNEIVEIDKHSEDTNKEIDDNMSYSNDTVENFLNNISNDSTSSGISELSDIVKSISTKSKFEEEKDDKNTITMENPIGEYVKDNLKDSEEDELISIMKELKK